jgi:3',5'-cyclic AMP phosphodiesterase CpdA
MLEQTLGTSRIAHLSDVHMLERRPGRSRARYDLRTQFVSIGRAMDARERSRKVTRAFAAAERAGATHFVVSGDLTELGTQVQYEAFAEAVAETGIPAHRITLVPGNHDTYSRPDAWRIALEGPLKPFAATSAGVRGGIVERGDIAFVPLDVTVHQPVTRSAGELSETTAAALERTLADTALRNKLVVLVQHHPPYPHKTGVWQWIDGLMGWARMMEILGRFPHVHLLHGHLHYAIDRLLGRARVFGAPAIVDDASDKSRIRLYDLRAGSLESVGVLET